MCNGCKHESACAKLKLVDYTQEPGPCFEPANHVSKFDFLREEGPGRPAILQLAGKSEPAPTLN